MDSKKPCTSSYPLALNPWVRLDCLFWGYATVIFLQGVVISPMPKPQPGWLGYPFSLGHHFDLSGIGGPTTSYATARRALRVIWAHKPHHYIKVGIPWVELVLLTVIISVKITGLWVIEPYSLVEFKCFRGIWCLHPPGIMKTVGTRFMTGLCSRIFGCISNHRKTSTI